jgi:hypothetical protein
LSTAAPSPSSPPAAAASLNASAAGEDDPCGDAASQTT